MPERTETADAAAQSSPMLQEKLAYGTTKSTPPQWNEHQMSIAAAKSSMEPKTQ
jgi:hypothetical protein